MRILFADDGVPYDGRTPAESPLGGGERAVVGLARALAGRGHDVSVATQLVEPETIDGVAWLPLPLPTRMTTRCRKAWTCWWP